MIMAYKNPIPAVDLIIEIEGQGLVLIERLNPPPGWALPGGFVEVGESLEQAAVREAKEETCLDVELLGQFHTYSDPNRDPRMHCISTVFIARATGTPRAEDDAKSVAIYPKDQLPDVLAFDHRQILKDYLNSHWLLPGGGKGLLEMAREHF
jgi:ADP-ribose pyrophosphatase YjhB (NUDIX family)